MRQNLFSAPSEEYTSHIQAALRIFDQIYPSYSHALQRVFSTGKEVIKEALARMITLHDLGKLTRRWQEGLIKNHSLPSHAPIGAAVLFKILPQGLKEPLSFAIAIHHTDKGLIGDNIEKPDSQAINEGIVDLEGRIVWHEDAFTLSKIEFPDEARTLTVYELKDMALGFRSWAKGGGLLTQHTRRIQAMLAHHILKLCDVYSARERDQSFEGDNSNFGGSEMTLEIAHYLKNLIKRSSYSHGGTKDTCDRIP